MHSVCLFVCLFVSDIVYAVTFMHVTFVLPHGDIRYIHWRKDKMHQSENRTQMTEDD